LSQRCSRGARECTMGNVRVYGEFGDLPDYLGLQRVSIACYADALY